MKKDVYMILFYGKQGVVRVLTSQGGFTRPYSIYFSLGRVRDVFSTYHTTQKEALA